MRPATMARDLRRVPLHCDPMLSPACNLRRRARFDLVSVFSWSAVVFGGGVVVGMAIGGVL